jgi:hypothetical protein
METITANPRKTPSRSSSRASNCGWLRNTQPTAMYALAQRNAAVESSTKNFRRASRWNVPANLEQGR